MKRKTLKKGIMLLAISTLSVSMLSGCSLLKPTANSLLKTCNKKMAKVKDMGIDAEMDFVMEVSKDGASVDIDLVADMDLAYEKTKEGYESYMDADIEVSLMGASQSVSGEVYTVVDKENVTSYSKSGDQDDWAKEVKKVDDSNSGLQNIANPDFSNLAKDMTLLEETKEVHGRECYVLTGVVEDTDMSDVLGAMDMEDLGDIDSLKAEITLNLDKKDKMPVSMIMKIDEDDFNKILEKEDFEGATVSLDSFTFEIVYKEINTGKAVEIPEKALEAEEKDDSDDGSGFFGDISDDDSDEDDEDIKEDDEDDKPSKDDEDKPAKDDEEKDDEDKPADDDEDKPAKDDEEDEDSDDDDSYSFGQGTMSLKEFKNQGFQFEEYVQEEEEAIYLKITNENKKAVSVTVYASFMKDGEVAYDSLNCLDFEPTTFQVADFNIKGDYDSIEYTFEIEECDKDLIGREMDVFYAIDDETVSGTVTNESSETAKFVEVHVVFYDDNGDIMEHNYTYVDADELAPGEKSDYSMYIYHPSKTNYDIYANCYTD